MNRRGLLKALPLAAIVGATVKLAEHQAMAYEMKPNRKYLFVISDISEKDTKAASAYLRLRGIDAVVCSGGNAAAMKIYELGGD